MKFVDALGVIRTARRFVSKGQNVHEDEVKSPDKLASMLRDIQRRLSDVEVRTPPEALEFEVTVGISGALTSLAHGLKGPVRFYVTHWTHANNTLSPVSSPVLVRSEASTANVLVLRSYVAGKAVVRVEPCFADVDPGVYIGDVAASVAGAVMRSGTVAPSAGTGNDGDFYINTTTSTLYGPKASGAWPTGVSLVGAAGANGSNGAAGSTGPAGPAPSGTGIVIVTAGVASAAYASDRGFRPSAMGTVLAPTATAGNATVATRFFTTRDCNCLGVRFYWKVAASKNIKASLWNAAGTRLANVTVAVAATGVVEATFASAQAITAGDLFRVSCWQTDSANYTATTSTLLNTKWPGGVCTTNVWAGGAMMLSNATLFASGDANPASTAVSEAYLLEPMLDF